MVKIEWNRRGAESKKREKEKINAAAIRSTWRYSLDTHRFGQKCPFTDSLHRLRSRFAQTSSVPLEINIVKWDFFRDFSNSVSNDISGWLLRVASPLRFEWLTWQKCASWWLSISLLPIVRVLFAAPPPPSNSPIIDGKKWQRICEALRRILSDDPSLIHNS